MCRWHAFHFGGPRLGEGGFVPLINRMYERAEQRSKYDLDVIACFTPPKWSRDIDYAYR